MSLLKVTNLTYTYGHGTPFVTHAVNNVSFSIESGEIIGIIGHTGSGKSTVVGMLNGLIKPEGGEVFLEGKNIWTDFPKIADVRFKVGLVMQYPEYQLFEETVFKDIAFGPLNMGVPESEIEERVLEAADFVGFERELLYKSPFDLSGGQKRRAAIAGIIAMRPEILVLDEPAAGLDPRGREAIFTNILNYQRANGNTVVIVSHSMEDMARLCDNIIVMSAGEILMSGDKDEVFTQSERLTSVGLDVPQITQLMNLLKIKGVECPDGIYTVEMAFEYLKNKLR